MRLIVSILANALALLITDWLLSGISIADFKTAVLAAIIIGLINTFIRPVLLFLTAPLNFLTLGLFTFVVNAIVLSIASWILGAGFVIENFWWAILAAAVLSIVSTTLSSLLRDVTR
ncbi:hypothetical protein A2631_03705 [Candidatus Daviesbacteria bacterium RIFCSPHIGHO2_01_FULL_44_29]|uniref:Phage holin family protein n=1 Tax=Candidatus Daviesbacteria bacterium RIFCSPHIGHO2_02_FULL_43_12 TaxID=1797776 RepID=A0A1F5KHZ8_9BACT|nr:MAG: hypothetical protein A2631_03705 [Candidatus Daviesbacteria bacterium RIFCSPHIGHO2_01_FULL_44_29]OGE39821.1 MAG: hypothetical protein A3E86_04600 [Candidatus Daviesbacteria bacterium RIFCSPHIGHO2_12_FULL_47_45]OGE40464.1 MAG: hypothetical protein A3D25_00165 [Candidatus Daviesbacteria bacterium RIFCSPHIGHO2_02_FULL_43_12]OGE70015.1 MAG: hypothetical protein A3B55_04970 [Candidatus Daviesbacteria bacterium RIFCSPLOWO2_01_FULL_43_15]